MDLAAPTAHSDHLIHRILSVLPSRGKPSSDVNIRMTDVFPEYIKPLDGSLQMYSTGRLLDRRCHELLSELISQKHKDALVTLRKRLVDVITEEDLSVNVSSMMRGAVNTKQLQSFIQVFRDNQQLIYKYPELLEYIEAALVTLEQSKQVFWDQLLSAEKVIQLNALSDNADTVATQLTDMLLHPIPGSEQYYPVHIVLKLAVFAYSLCTSSHEPKLWTDEMKFKDALAEAIVSRPQDSQTLLWLNTNLQDRLREHYQEQDQSSDEALSRKMGLKMEVTDELEEKSILDTLHHISIWRSGLQDYQTLLVQKGVTSQYKSQISQLLEHLFESKGAPLRDLERVQDAISGLLRSGFGRLGLKSKTHPTSSSLLILYVLGGITTPEMKEIREIMAGHSQQVIGSFPLSWYFVCSPMMLL